MYKIVGGVLQYAPIGVFALIAIVFGKQGAKAFGPLGMVTLTFYIGFVVQLFLVYGAFLRIFGLSLGESPLPYILESAKKLEKIGVDAICMPCNTSHYFEEEIKKILKFHLLVLFKV